MYEQVIHHLKKLDFGKWEYSHWFTIDDIRHKGRILDYATLRFLKVLLKKAFFQEIQ